MKLQNIIYNKQKQPFRGVLTKSSSENMQQIYRRTPMPKCNFKNGFPWKKGLFEFLNYLPLCKKIGKQTDRQTGTKTDTKTDRKTDTKTETSISISKLKRYFLKSLNKSTINSTNNVLLYG